MIIVYKKNKIKRKYGKNFNFECVLKENVLKKKMV